MRTVQTILSAMDAMDGAGVKIKRHSPIHHGLADPFIMLDEIRSDDKDDFIAGFPPHPHRGIETLTYMRVGGIRHEDNMGNVGEVLGGGVQWMRAGKGVIHGEMPLKEHDQMHGFQLWINLNSRNKMQPAEYRDVPKNEIKHVEIRRGMVHVIAGEWQLQGQTINGPLDRLEGNSHIIDIELEAGAEFQHEIEKGHHLVVAVYDGELMADKPIKTHQMALFNDDGRLELTTDSGAKALILHGVPNKEPIANYGPFVMNTPEEIEQAIQDYQSGTLTL
ncbi:pirin family protein [Bermanella marisrubri]|uniref:Pirin-related protein n=1 Tax=Bermanella marisrubri TaxID=207949 RepID=Q1N5V4_9GAMM|nr:pirin family protein [Bermanella marisrubri]EAT13838.1 Pirin-related protein [Oceanobacter sp. RED65] [Bermanella marisrubri]QIZ84601.1 pirin family protein [Bermanella marisrubri]